MYRDFSEKSRNELLGLVSQVENEKYQTLQIGLETAGTILNRGLEN